MQILAKTLLKLALNLVLQLSCMHFVCAIDLVMHPDDARWVLHIRDACG